MSGIIVDLASFYNFLRQERKEVGAVAVRVLPLLAIILFFMFNKNR